MNKSTQAMIHGISCEVGTLMREAYWEGDDRYLSLLDAFISLRQSLPKVSDGSGRHEGYSESYPTTQPSGKVPMHVQLENSSAISL